MLNEEASSTIFLVFGMTRPGIESRSPGPLGNILTAGKLMKRKIYSHAAFAKMPDIYIVYFRISVGDGQQILEFIL